MFCSRSRNLRGNRSAKVLLICTSDGTRCAAKKQILKNSSRTSKRIRSEFSGPKEELHHERSENCIKIVKL